MNERLAELEKLRDGWLNGDGLSVSPRVIDWCRDNLPIMILMHGHPRIYPTPEGGIQVEWEKDGVDVTINIDDLGREHSPAEGTGGE